MTHTSFEASPRWRPEASGGGRVGLRWMMLGFIAGAVACAGALWAGELWRGSSGASPARVPPPVTSGVLSASPTPEIAATMSRAEPFAEPTRAEPARAPGAPARPVIVATARSTYIYDAPSFEARRAGYLRAGEAVARSSDPAGFEACPGGFFAIEPRGYVCAGEWASADAAHPAARRLSPRADRSALLPYRYGLSRFPTPPLYTRVPTYTERASQEPELHYHVRHLGESAWREVARDPVPETLAKGGSAPTFDGDTQRGAALAIGRAIPGSGFAFLSLFEIDGYQYGLSTELSVLPLDRLTPVEPSHFRGLRLTREASLPVAFVHTRRAVLETGDPRGKLQVKRPLDYREVVLLSGNRVRSDGVTYHETRWGDWVRDQRLIVVEPLSRPPSWATPGRRWLDVSILKQTLVAYEGTEPVFVTLVSTGRDGLSSAGKHATVQGTFVIHTKHVTWNMGSGETGEAYDLRDVPYVQYFHDGFALHGTYWHDAFGTPRSHGCVNLSPHDARFLFEWTDPEVPQRWHGAFGSDGTIVFIHP